MNKARYSKFICVVSSTIISANVLYAAHIPNKGDPSTFLGPVFRGSYNSTLDSFTAYNLAGEAAPKHYRVSGSYGWNLSCKQRLKVTAEYLYQRIYYPFFSGNKDRWVNQGAIGGDYQYDLLGYIGYPQFNLMAFYSNAPEKNLGTITGTFVSLLGVTTPFIDHRRIAGSNAAGISPGIRINPWCGARMGLDFNYDYVRYNKHNEQDEKAVGVGGTIFVKQEVIDDVLFGVSAAVRRPFNNYQASITWVNALDGCSWDTIGIEGEYTVGKHTLPNTYNLGLTVNYYLDQCCCPDKKPTFASQNTKDFLNFMGETNVYLPQVLVISESNLQLG